MGGEQNRDSQPQKLLWRYVWLVFCVLAMGVFLSVVHDRQSARKASALVSYAYAGAAQGLTPNGLWLDVSEVHCEEVLQAALEQLNLQGSVTAAELLPCITVEPVAEKAVLERDDFFCTDYRITLKADALALGTHRAEEVLSAVCEEYQRFFWQSYGEDLSLLTQPLEWNEAEPLSVQVSALELQTRRLIRYLSTRLSRDDRFGALDKKANNLQQYALPTVQELLTNTGEVDWTLVRQYAEELEDLRANLLEVETEYQAEQQSGLSIRTTDISLWQRIAPGRTLLELVLFFLAGAFFLSRSKKRRAGAAR